MSDGNTLDGCLCVCVIYLHGLSEGKRKPKKGDKNTTDLQYLPGIVKWFFDSLVKRSCKLWHLARRNTPLYRVLHLGQRGSWILFKFSCHQSLWGAQLVHLRAYEPFCTSFSHSRLGLSTGKGSQTIAIGFIGDVAKASFESIFHECFSVASVCTCWIKTNFAAEQTGPIGHFFPSGAFFQQNHSANWNCSLLSVIPCSCLSRCETNCLEKVDLSLEYRVKKAQRECPSSRKWESKVFPASVHSQHLQMPIMQVVFRLMRSCNSSLALFAPTVAWVIEKTVPV